ALTTPFNFTATSITGDTTVYANWTVNPYTVAFNTDGGSTVASQTVNYDAKAAKPAVDPTKAGHTFAGWYANSALTVPFNFTATAIQADTSVYAKWTVNPYTVAFNTDGGSSVASQTVNYDAKATKPAVDPTKPGYTFAGWYANSAMTVPFDFTATSITADTTVYAKWTTNATAPVQQPDEATNNQDAITINGISVPMTKTYTLTSDGRQMVVVSLDEQTLTQSLLQGKLKTTIAVDADEKVVQVQLPANAVLALVNQLPNAVITIERPGASYSLPVSLLRDMPKGSNMTVSIGAASAQANSEVETAASGLGAELLNKPTEFTVAVDGNERQDFGSIYVDRTIWVPGTLDPLHTTAVWLDSQGKLQVVPTTFASGNGGTIVTIHVPHNSVYSVVRLDRTFADLQGYWAKSDVELLANRMIVNGMTANTFAPNSNITRAEFAALLVRALGLQETAPEQPYADVQASDWFYGAIGAAQKAGLINGTGSNTFQPGASITREQMVLMVVRAMQIGSGDQAAAVDLSILGSFADRSSIASWAQEAAAQALDAGIIQGMTATSFAPQATATRAQSAVMLKRLLQHLHFINE
ncbi:InlB B-repeat-containing protein, partial [Paenibacillus kobensis]|uniref:InlB B-repeat-containing protein n=1 Tax=Paenibacillus kobensis TaxID=59841 RepID=UPI001580AD5A